GLVDERLRLLQAEPGRGTHDLDDLDLLVSGTREHDVEGGLLLLGRPRPVAARGRRRSGRRHGGRRDAELLFEGLDPLGELHDRDALQLLDPFLCSDVGLGSHSYWASSSLASVCCSVSAAASGSSPASSLGSASASGSGAASASPSGSASASVSGAASASAAGAASASGSAPASASAAGATSPGDSACLISRTAPRA